MFRDVCTQLNPRSDWGSLCASCCCQGVSLTGIHLVFPEGARTQTSPKLLQVWQHSPHSCIADKPGSSSCQCWSFISLPHQRLLASSLAAESQGCFPLFRSEFTLWSVGNQTPGSNTSLSVWRCSNRRAREFCLCRDRFVPVFPPGKLHSMLWKP